MPAPSSDPGGSPYLLSRTRRLGEVCRELGRDDAGRACCGCPVHDMCVREEAASGDEHNRLSGP